MAQLEPLIKGEKCGGNILNRIADRNERAV